MKESEVEKTFKKRAEKLLKCWAVKFVSPGNDGMPDRLILAPGGKALFVELKQSGKKLRPLQKKRIEYLRSLGFFATVLAGAENIDAVLAEMQAYLKRGDAE